MCVSTAHRNKGIGRLLFDALNAHLESEKFTKITAVAVQDSEKFMKVAPVESVIRPIAQLHVPLRHRLLPQPGGLEGFVGVGESLPPHDRAIP